MVVWRVFKWKIKESSDGCLGLSMLCSSSRCSRDNWLWSLGKIEGRLPVDPEEMKMCCVFM